MCRVAAYNCRQAPDRTTHFHASAEADGAEVSCTQESGGLLYLREFLALPGIFRAPAYLDDGCSVLSKSRTRPLWTDAVEINAGSNHNRQALLIRLRNGLIVANVHLTSRNEPRSRAELNVVYESIQANFAGCPWLIIGDFNHDPSGDYAGVLFANGPQHECGRYLDWAMAGNVMALAAHHYPRYGGSDHGPWRVDLVL